MNLLTLSNIMWIISKQTIQEYQDKLNDFTAKYISSPIMGYVVFFVLMAVAFIFIRGNANK